MFWKLLYDKHLRLSILDIALAGIFIALWIVSYKYISINLRFMRLGIVYAWVIIIGLIFKPFNAVLIAIIGDTLALFSSSNPLWMLEFAIIYPGIALLVSLLKKLLNCQKDWLWVIFSTLTLLISVSVVISFSIIYHNFTNKSQNEAVHFLFNHWTIYLVVGAATGLIIIFYCFLITKYYLTKNPKYKVQAAILTIVSLVIILFIWIWGPIAQMRYLSSKSRLIQSYHLYLVPRVLKTAIILPVYFVIVNSVYQAYKTLQFNAQNKW